MVKAPPHRRQMRALRHRCIYQKRMQFAAIVIVVFVRVFMGIKNN